MSFVLLQNKRSGKRIIFYSTPELRSLSRLRKRIKLSSMGLRYRTFLSLTFKNEPFPREASMYMRKFMNRMKTYYRKYCRDHKIIFQQKNFAYIWKIELGSSSSRIHIHVLLTCHYVPREKIEKWWVCDSQEKESLGFIKIKRLWSSKMINNYMMKYFSKKGKISEIKDANRRFGVSRYVNEVVRQIKMKKNFDEWELVAQYEYDKINPQDLGNSVDYWNAHVLEEETHYEISLPLMYEEKKIQKILK